ncbi:M48 family metallopeptidase [Pseudomonadales bacterium]|nr:M48 family metallopeptidase [Pseudomonadales bacterium]
MQLILPLLNDDSPTEKIAPPVTPPLPTSAADKIPSIIDDADYQLIRSKRKTLAVSILDGKVTVRAPFRMPNYLITIFIQEKSNWINKQVTRQRVQLTQTLEIVDGAEFSVLGEPCFINIEHSIQRPHRKRANILLRKNQLHIQLTADASSHSERSHAQARKLFCHWLKAHASAYMVTATHQLARAMGLFDKLGVINYRYTRTKWGHCTSEGNIQYNPSISLAPLFVIDYIIAHEVCHLRHRNHSKSFWQLVEKVCPDWQQAEKWLNTEAHRIAIGPS